MELPSWGFNYGVKSTQVYEIRIIIKKGLGEKAAISREIRTCTAETKFHQIKNISLKISCLNKSLYIKKSMFFTENGGNKKTLAHLNDRFGKIGNISVILGELKSNHISVIIEKAGFSCLPLLVMKFLDEKFPLSAF